MDNRNRQAGKAQFRRGLTDTAAREVVMDGEDGVLGVGEVMHDDLTEGCKRLSQPRATC